MNRREFLQVFGFAAAVIVLPGAPTPDEEPCADYTETPALPYDGIPYLAALNAYGTLGEHRYGYFGLKRTDSTIDLLQFGLSTWGGSTHWRALPGEEIYVPDGYPVTLWSSPGIKASGAIRLQGVNRYLVLQTSGTEQGALI